MRGKRIKKKLAKEEIFKFLKENKSFFYTQFGVVKIGIFGSILHNPDFKDVDLLIELSEEKKDIHNYLAFKRFLEKVFGKKVDLCLENTLKPYIKEQIKKEIIYV